MIEGDEIRTRIASTPSPSLISLHFFFQPSRLIPQSHKKNISIAINSHNLMAIGSEAAHAAATLRGLFPLPTQLGRSVRKSQIPSTIFMRRVAVKASGNQFGSGDPSRVDAEMIVLRKRIQELRMQETNYLPPPQWMKWEKEWSVTYASDISQFMGWLQNMLYNTRPALAIAALALILVSVPTFVLLLVQFILGSLDTRF